jgi:hypothetical protein
VLQVPGVADPSKDVSETWLFLPFLIEKIIIGQFHLKRSSPCPETFARKSIQVHFERVGQVVCDMRSVTNKYDPTRMPIQVIDIALRQARLNLIRNGVNGSNGAFGCLVWFQCGNWIGLNWIGRKNALTLVAGAEVAAKECPMLKLTQKCVRRWCERKSASDSEVDAKVRPTLKWLQKNVVSCRTNQRSLIKVLGGSCTFVRFRSSYVLHHEYWRFRELFCKNDQMWERLARQFR